MTDASPTTEPTLTPDQIATMQRQLAAQEQTAHQQFGEALATFLQQHGYQIVAWPAFALDGRTVAQWGYRRVAG